MQHHPLPNGGTLTHLSRSDWGGGILSRGNPIKAERVKGLVLHHIPDLPKAMGIQLPPNSRDMAEPIRFMQRLQTVRPDLGSEVPYSFVILKGSTTLDAVVAEGRGPLRSGAHTAGLNSVRYGVAVAQNTNDEPMTPGQIEAFRWIGRTYLTADDLEPTGGHNDFANVHHLNNTECPGKGGIETLNQLQPPYGAGQVIAPEKAPSTPIPLQRGDTGAAVTNWQKILLALGFELAEFGADGDFGEETEAATRQLEKSMNLAEDGVVSVEQARLAMNLVSRANDPEREPEAPNPAVANLQAVLKTALELSYQLE